MAMHGLSGVRPIIAGARRRAPAAGAALLLAGLLVSAARAETNQLEGWIDQALAANPGLASMRSRWDAARAAASGVGSLPDPMVGADFERMDSTTLFDYSDVEVMASQTLPWFGLRRLRADVAGLEAEAAGFEYLEVLRKVQSEVIQSHAALWLAGRSIGLMSNTLAVLNQMERAMEIQYEAGTGTQADLLRVRVERARMANEVVTMERDRDTARASLNALLDAPLHTARALADPPARPVLAVALTDLLAQARRYCCVLVARDKRREAREKAAALARRAYAPEVQLRVEARQYNGESDFREYDTGVFLTLPWIWRGKYGAEIRRSAAEHEQAEHEFSEEANQTQLDIQRMYTMADESRRKLELIEGTLLPQATNLVAASRAAYEAGKGTYSDFVDAQRMLLEIRLDQARAETAFATNFARLDQIAAPWGPRERSTGLIDTLPEAKEERPSKP